MNLLGIVTKYSDITFYSLLYLVNTLNCGLFWTVSLSALFMDVIILDSYKFITTLENP